MLALAFAALLVLALPALIEGPETAAEEQACPVQSALPQAILALRTAETADNALTSTPERAGERAVCPGSSGSMSRQVTPPVTDGNGWIVVGRSWSAAAYAACPPEGMPG